MITAIQVLFVEQCQGKDRYLHLVNIRRLLLIYLEITNSVGQTSCLVVLCNGKARTFMGLICLNCFSSACKTPSCSLGQSPIAFVGLCKAEAASQAPLGPIGQRQYPAGSDWFRRIAVQFCHLHGYWWGYNFVVFSGGARLTSNAVVCRSDATPATGHPCTFCQAAGGC